MRSQISKYKKRFLPKKKFEIPPFLKDRLKNLVEHSEIRQYVRKQVNLSNFRTSEAKRARRAQILYLYLEKEWIISGDQEDMSVSLFQLK